MSRDGGGRPTIWWHLAMRYHVAPYVGHSPGKARDCYECRKIAALVDRVIGR